MNQSSTAGPSRPQDRPQSKPPAGSGTGHGAGLKQGLDQATEQARKLAAKDRAQGSNVSSERETWPGYTAAPAGRTPRLHTVIASESSAAFTQNTSQKYSQAIERAHNLLKGKGQALEHTESHCFNCSLFLLVREYVQGLRLGQSCRSNVADSAATYHYPNGPMQDQRSQTNQANPAGTCRHIHLNKPFRSCTNQHKHASQCSQVAVSKAA